VKKLLNEVPAQPQLLSTFENVIVLFSNQCGNYISGFTYLNALLIA